MALRERTDVVFSVVVFFFFLIVIGPLHLSLGDDETLVFHEAFLIDFRDGTLLRGLVVVLAAFQGIKERFLLVLVVLLVDLAIRARRGESLGWLEAVEVSSLLDGHGGGEGLVFDGVPEVTAFTNGEELFAAGGEELADDSGALVVVVGLAGLDTLVAGKGGEEGGTDAGVSEFLPVVPGSRGVVARVLKGKGFLGGLIFLERDVVRVLELFLGLEDVDHVPSGLVLGEVLLRAQVGLDVVLLGTTHHGAHAIGLSLLIELPALHVGLFLADVLFQEFLLLVEKVEQLGLSALEL